MAKTLKTPISVMTMQGPACLRILRNSTNLVKREFIGSNKALLCDGMCQLWLGRFPYPREDKKRLLHSFYIPLEGQDARVDTVGKLVIF